MICEPARDRVAEIRNRVGMASLVAAAHPEHPEVDSMLALYLAVAASGVIEECVTELLVAYARRNGNQQVGDYVWGSLNRYFQNPKIAKIYDFLGYFDREWVKEMKTRLPQRAEQALNALVDTKNDLAHRGTPQLNLTVRDVQDHLAASLVVLDLLEEVLTRPTRRGPV